MRLKSGKAVESDPETRSGPVLQLSIRRSPAIVICTGLRRARHLDAGFLYATQYLLRSKTLP
jgi:hypothetical protein